MQVMPLTATTERYARCIQASKRIRWEIDRDVIKGRKLDFGTTFLPDGLARMGALEFLTGDERRFASQIQGRTYANMFGLVERFIAAKVLEVSREHWFGDQVALEALVRFTDEELKHQELFRRIERLAAAGKPVAAVCHGPAAFRRAKGADGAPLVKGKTVTGFSNSEEAAVGLTGVVPFSVEDALKADGGRYSRGEDWASHAVVDGNLITGQNPASSEATAKALLEALAPLETGLTGRR